MISDQISENVSRRLLEVQRTLALIRTLESNGVEGKDPVSAESAAILRGLFFVHLYGALEYAVTVGVQVLLQEMTKVGVPFCQFEHMLYAVVLDDNFRSLADPGQKKQWEKRRELLTRQISRASCSFNDSVFSDHLQNVWDDNLRSMFESLCISESEVPEDRMRGYIDEVVGRRNAVAHGRQSAQEVGRGVTSSELEERLDAITKIVDHIVAVFDDYLESRAFIRPQHRPSGSSAVGDSGLGLN